MLSGKEFQSSVDDGKKMFYIPLFLKIFIHSSLTPRVSLKIKCENPSGVPLSVFPRIRGFFENWIWTSFRFISISEERLFRKCIFVWPTSGETGLLPAEWMCIHLSVLGIYSFEIIQLIENWILISFFVVTVSSIKVFSKPSLYQ